MIFRQSLYSTKEMAAWYDQKYREMGGCWYTPPEELDRHLDDFGLTPYTGQEFPPMVVDIGCGDGSLVERIWKRGYLAFGLEISQEAISSRSRGPMFKFDICNGPLSTKVQFVISLGSLEHVIDIHTALDNIRMSLTSDGRWYFFVPNELWIHEDQPNERIGTDWEWEQLFALYGLVTESVKRWNDCSAIQGRVG